MRRKRDRPNLQSQWAHYQEGRSAGNFRGTDESPPFLKVRARGHVTLYDDRRARVTCTKHRRRSRRHPDVVNELIRRRQPALARVAARAAPSPTARAVAARAAPSRSLRPESHAGVVQCSSARSRGVGGRERQWVADLDLTRRRSPPFTTSRTRSCTSQILMSTSWSRTAVAGPN